MTGRLSKKLRTSLVFEHASSAQVRNTQANMVATRGTTTATTPTGQVPVPAPATEPALSQAVPSGGGGAAPSGGGGVPGGGPGGGSGGPPGGEPSPVQPGI